MSLKVTGQGQLGVLTVFQRSHLPWDWTVLWRQSVTSLYGVIVRALSVSVSAVNKNTNKAIYIYRPKTS